MRKAALALLISVLAIALPSAVLAGPTSCCGCSVEACGEGWFEDKVTKCTEDHKCKSESKEDKCTLTCGKKGDPKTTKELTGKCVKVLH
jgi:hypothetical protein